MTPQPQPWQVWWVDFNPQVGREQAGRRPAIVVGTRFACALPNGLAVVIPCTTRDRGLPWQPAVDLGGTRGVALCEQIKSISVSRLKKPHPGTLTEHEIAEIRTALRRIIDL